MKIYISLPITGYDLQERKQYADSVKKRLQQVYTDSEIVTPFEINPNQELSYAEYMGNGIAALLASDAVYFCKGWDKSSGCRLEHSAAFEYQISKFYEP